jgi:hypothetical protein
LRSACPACMDQPSAPACMLTREASDRSCLDAARSLARPWSYCARAAPCRCSSFSASAASAAVASLMYCARAAADVKTACAGHPEGRCRKMKALGVPLLRHASHMTEASAEMGACLLASQAAQCLPPQEPPWACRPHMAVFNGMLIMARCMLLGTSQSPTWQDQ